MEIIATERLDCSEVLSGLVARRPISEKPRGIKEIPFFSLMQPATVYY